MSPVSSVDQVFQAVQRARTGARAFCTNFFPVQSKLHVWIDHQELLLVEMPGIACFARKDRDFWHLYFCSASPENLPELCRLSFLATERVALDLLGNESMVADLSQPFLEAGFKPYSRLVRLSRTADPADKNAALSSEITFADLSDAGPLQRLLETSFDRFADQLPVDYEIRAAIENRQILCARVDGQLAACLHFETQGFTSTIRYWVVGAEFKSRGFGSALIRRYFADQPGVKRFILWVTVQNEDALQKYRHYGYSQDGLTDLVLVNKMIAHE